MKNETDRGLPWVRGTSTPSGRPLIFDADQDLVATFYTEAARNHALACVQALNGIDPAKLSAVFAAIRGLSAVEKIATAQEEAVLTAARAAGIIGGNK